MKKIICLLVVLISGCTSSFDLTKKDIEDKGFYVDTGYYRIDFNGHEIIKIPPGAHIVQGTKDQAVGAIGVNDKIGLFVVKGDISLNDVVLLPQVNGYDYVERFTVGDPDGNPLPLVRYLLTNECDGKTYEGLSNKHGETVAFSTEKPCELSISFPDSIN
ncbi:MULTISPECIES: hypothetical protein [unclassified Brenneria]|uniref:hypothetical protein n=1 Tax=unclassified Brenneria TaxID=2634434 RepID=UPI0029C4E9AB|nr:MULTISPECIES: hypothetical protein [unclassified Brenneria]MDX5626945.1 hypothetical protein [Brenneria sp. L3-3Z]MDX5693705.1 hypothetical protein [Brenneria sp. L4-2C]MEE3661654.1 hypothetical protein [Brenneria sp. g21c3]